MGRDHSEGGISSIGAMIGLASLLVVLLIVSIAVTLTLPSTTTTTTTTSTSAAAAASAQAGAHASTTTTAAAGGSPAPVSAADVAACQSDVSVVQVALQAYQATNGSYPTPPAVWSAATYPTNFAPLTTAPPPGPFLKMPPGDNRYVILWDASGNVWVEPPGTFSPTYDAANDAANPSTCARVAR